MNPSHTDSSGGDVINFDIQGVMSYHFKMVKRKILKDVIMLKFQTGVSDGVIPHKEGQQGDFIMLELRRKRLLFYIYQFDPCVSQVRLSVSSLHFLPVHALVFSRHYSFLLYFKDMQSTGYSKLP